MQQFTNAVKQYSEQLHDETDRNELASELIRICKEEDIEIDDKVDLVDIITTILPFLTGAGAGTIFFKLSGLAGKFLKHKNKVNDIFVDHGVPVKSNTSGFLSVTGLLLGKEEGLKVVDEAIQELDKHSASYSAESDHSTALEQVFGAIIKNRYPNVFNTVESLKLLS